uniref:Uncharacterized protein n=1 Tax=Rhodococcus hoagii TaxID=43767 RepID=A0A0F7ICG2_RHOHA|nr:hypothetical protein pVAPN_1040 [Prescottella equi]
MSHQTSGTHADAVHQHPPARSPGTSPAVPAHHRSPYEVST